MKDNHCLLLDSITPSQFPFEFQLLDMTGKNVDCNGYVMTSVVGIHVPITCQQRVQSRHTKVKGILSFSFCVCVSWKSVAYDLRSMVRSAWT